MFFQLVTNLKSLQAVWANIMELQRAKLNEKALKGEFRANMISIGFVPAIDNLSILGQHQVNWFE